MHRWFANKSCPGEWLYERLPDLAEKVTAGLQEQEESTPESTTVKKKYCRVQVGAFSVKSNAENMLKKLKAAGFSDAYIKYGE